MRAVLLTLAILLPAAAGATMPPPLPDEAPAPHHDGLSASRAALDTERAALLNILMSDATVIYNHRYAVVAYGYTGSLADYAAALIASEPAAGNAAPWPIACQSYRTDWGDYHGYYPDPETGAHLPGCGANGQWVQPYLDYLAQLQGSGYHYEWARQ